MAKPKAKPRPRSPRIGYTRMRNPYNNLFLDLFTRGGGPASTPGNLPSHIKVYGQKYKIYYHSRIYNAPKKTQRLRGVVLYGPRIIFLDPEQSLHQLKETLYHEVGHIYLKTWQCKSESLNKITYQQMEDFCDLIGEAIPDLMGNNLLSD